VYDVAGRKVATLAQGTMSAGSHEVSWNGAKAPAGVYLYRLSFEGKTLTNRMVVVR
jgi:flagellar hook assembly protein FlgD